MTDHAAPSDSSLFSPVEVEQFQADDVEAGSAIGKMLSALFLYTVLAMSFVAWWTFSTLSQSQPAESSARTHHADH
ncbi:MAG: hypothetical protein R3C49_11745 [Planctomycetaceae bacterium]